MKTMNRNAARTRRCLLLILCLSVFALGTSVSLAEDVAPDAPQNLHATETTVSAVTLAWDAVSGAASYRFYRNGSYVESVSGTSYTAAGLTTDTVYGFRVAAVSSGGTVGPGSDSIYVRTKQEPLAAPQNLRSTAVTTNSVTLAWDAVSSAASYRFYLNGSYVGSVSGTSYTAAGLSSNTVYGFRVAAVSSSGTVGQGSESVYVRTEALLTAPQNLRYIAKTTASVTLAWEAVSGTNSYRVYQNGSYIESVSGTSYTAAGLSSNTVYGFRVAAVTGGGSVGSGSNSIYVRTDPAQLAAPQNLHATSTTYQSVALAWSAVPDAGSYRVYRNGSFVTAVSTTTYEDGRLSPDTVYGFRVAAVSADGGTIGPDSDSVYLRTKQAPPAQPQNLRATPKTISVALAWDSASGADHYRIYRDGRYVDYTYELSFTVTGLSPETDYSFQVIGVTADGTVGPFSASVDTRTLSLLPAPQNVWVTQAGPYSIAIAWDAVPGANHYRVYADGRYTDYIYDLFYTCTDLIPNHSYIFSVAAVDDDGVAGKNFYLETIKTTRGMLPAPKNLHAANIGSDSITMAWDIVKYIDHYELDMNGDQVGATYLLYYTVTGLTPDTVYSFQVNAYDDWSAGIQSEAVDVRTLLPAPLNLHATAVQTDSITLAWDAVSGANHYRFYLNGSYAGRTDSTTYTAAGLMPNTVYGFRVAAVDDNSRVGPGSNSVYVRTQKVVLAAPQNLHSTAVSADSITMAWDAVSGASSYRFYLNGSYTGSASGTAYTCTGLTPDTVYGFRVAAVGIDSTVGPGSSHVYIRTQQE